jgi:NADPH:quinone reductase
MKAIAITQPRPLEDPECFTTIDLPLPGPGPRDLRVRVQAVSVNPIDTKIRRRRRADEHEPRILGWDAAGIVDAVGAATTQFHPGDQVFYSGEFARPGSNAEFQLVDERLAALKPRTLSFSESAALPLTTITAWECLFDRLRIRPDLAVVRGETLVVLGGAGGVGSIMIQLARQMTGLTVVASASRAEASEWCRQLGAHHVINHAGNWPEELKSLGIAQAHYIACLTDPAPHWPLLAACVAPQGAICGIVDSTAPLDLNLLKSKSATFVWEFMFTRSMFQTADLTEQQRVLAQVAGMVDGGLIRSTLSQIVGPLCPETLAQTHRQLESNHTMGKLVLTV